MSQLVATFEGERQKGIKFIIDDVYGHFSPLRAKIQ